MRNLLHCRRGSVAFATVVALVPLIGVVALGAEAGSWYVTKQHTQNAADAAAYSGALQLACLLAGSSCTVPNSTVDYSGKQFAAQNTFCNAGDATAYPGSQCPTSLPVSTSRTVQIDRGTFAANTWTSSATGSFVRAVVSQQQPAYLATVLGLSTVNIGATAVASVVNLTPNPPCILTLTGSLSFQGSPNINAQNCGLASNSQANNAIDFTGGGMTLSGSISAAGGCTGAASFCNKAFLHTPPVQNPFALLDAVSLPTMANCPVDKKNPTLTAWSAANPCKNDSVSLTGGATITLCGSGVYFISGTLSLKGGSLIQTGSPTTTPPCSPASTTGTALFILLPDASLDTKGGGTINITGNPSVTASQLPTVLQPYAGLFAYMAIYDQSGAAVTFGGNSNINLTGNIYAPAAAVTFQGNPTIDVGNGKRCGELIAASVAFNGNATLDSSGCPLIQQVPNPPQYVQLVQ